MNTRAYRLHFTAPLHLDDKGTGFYQHADALIHSDTLSAAILSAWAQLDPDPQRKEERFKTPPFKVSSAFPYFGNQYFLPRPINSRAISLPSEQLQLNKKIKKIKYLETTLWQTVVANKNFWQNLATNLDTEKSDYVILAGGLLMERKAISPYLIKGDSQSFKLWETETQTRVVMNRATGSTVDGGLFDFTRIHYHPNSGLYFLVQLESGQQPDFEAALAWLGDSGIGSDRACGNGLFEWKPAEQFRLPQVTSPMALSLVLPNPEDCQKDDWLKDSAYELIKRGGWVTGTGWRKPAVWMFGEGSCFVQSLQGKIETLGNHPDGYPIYRDGRGFFVGGKQ
ncbi:MAG: type III-A CRISPR-associated RAMP protein Csm4 [Thiotrichaceae bacterium IS1]|nr:MAG: type III-A CRISPR-associated RAMP protein Csm4 [Thiotrichaceae bacterium IS1]